jgi:ectoine hydroxylase
MTNDIYPSRVADRPIWLDRQDPVAHAPWTRGAPITEAQQSDYETNGYLVLRGLFEPAEVAALQAEMERLRAGPAGLDPDTLIAEPGSRMLRSVFAVHEQSQVMGRLAADARLVAVARHLLDDGVYVHQSRLNYKPGFGGKEFCWHSDFETWHVEDGMPRMRALSMSILLMENTVLNGPLMLVPGSHRNFVACVGETPEEHYKDSLRKQEYGVPDQESLTKLAESGGIAAPAGKAGDVVLFDCNTMHGSNGNITPFPRANAFIVYNAVSNALVAPFGGTLPRPPFVAARGSVTAIRPIDGHFGGGRRAA